MIRQANKRQISGLVSRHSNDYGGYVDETNPWPGEFDSEEETEDDYVNPVDPPNTVEADDEEQYVAPNDPEPNDEFYETVDELKLDARPIQPNVPTKETKRPPHPHPLPKAVTKCTQPPSKPRQQLSSRGIHQAGVAPGAPSGAQEIFYKNTDDGGGIPGGPPNQPTEDTPPPLPAGRRNRSEVPVPSVPTVPRQCLVPPAFDGVPPVPTSHQRPYPTSSLHDVPRIPSSKRLPAPPSSEVPPVPTTQRPSGPVPTPLEVPPVPTARRISPVPSHPDVPSASTSRRAAPLPPPDLPSPSKPAAAAPTLTPIPSSQPAKSPVAATSTSKATQPAAFSSRRPSKEMALESQGWYVGDCNPTEADRILKKAAEDGSFLVRNSQRSGNPYTLCVIHEGDIRRFPIRKRNEDGNFALGTPKPDELVFSSVVEMIRFHRNNPIEYGRERAKIALRRAAIE